MKLKPSSESVADQVRRMGRTDFAAGVSRDLGQQAWMPHSLARIHWLEGWDGAGTMSKPIAYYNEHDPKAAAWLRELIKANLIAPGVVDERSIEDVLPSELDGFTQCHFFAGIGVWSYALRCAGWPDDQPVWTGSCPCQPFSTAGKGGGTDDERHLWPSFFWLIKQCQPPVIFGEQVASKDGLAWLDIVQSDLEAEKYAVAPFDLCAAGFGAPHIRQRLFFVADSMQSGRAERWAESRDGQVAGSGQFSNVADPAGNDQRRIRQSRARIGRRELPIGGHGATGILADADGKQVDTANERRSHAEPVGDCAPGSLADAESGRGGAFGQSEDQRRSDVSLGGSGELGELGNTAGGRLGVNGSASWGGGHADKPNATNGFWADAEWLYCRDEKYRAVEPGTFPLAHGAAARVGRLRGYGNAIVAPVAEEFIRAYLEKETSQ